MRGKTVFAGLILALSGAAASAQTAARVPTANDIYCAGVVTSEHVPQDSFIITGEQSSYRVTFEEGDYVYVNKGSSQGVKVGDAFTVIRPTFDWTEIEWSQWEFSILKKLGTVWEDEGKVRVVVTQPNVSIAQIEHSCGYMQRGDVVLPFVERPKPRVKTDATFDRFAPPSGKAAAMIVATKDFQSGVGSGDSVYVNLGSNQGVKVGDYFRIFRYAGTQRETAYQTRRFAFDADAEDAVFGRQYGYGSVPQRYKWDNVPREVLGEGIVVRVSPNSSSVLVTFTLHECYTGDYIEIE
jgi:hypothetical protein